jgi:hypothetical protein
MLRSRLFSKNKYNVIAKSYRGVRMASFKMVKQKGESTYAVAAEMSSAANKNTASNELRTNRLFSFMAKYRMTSAISQSYLQTLMPSILYEKKAPKGKYIPPLNPLFRF